MKKKTILIFALFSILSLGIGLGLGFGLKSSNLFGTAIHPDPIVVVNGQSYDLQNVMASLQIERANIIESQIKDQLKQINYQNTLLKEADQYINEVLAKKPEPDGTVALSQNLYDFCKKNGIPVVGDANTLLTQEQCNSILGYLRPFAEAAQDLSLAEMLRLQSLIVQRNESVEMLANYTLS